VASITSLIEVVVEVVLWVCVCAYMFPLALMQKGYA
jgi:hypothetical protein